MKSVVGIAAAAVAVFIVGVMVGRMGSAPAEKTVVHEKTVLDVLEKAKPQEKETIVVSSVVPVQELSSDETLFSAVNARQIEQMIKNAVASQNAVEKDSLIYLLHSEWSKKDPAGALEYARELERPDLMYSSLLHLGKSNSDAAFQWIEQNAKNSGQSNNLLTAVYQGMAQVDPAGTIAQVEQLEAGAQRDVLLMRMVDEWAKQDVRAAFDWMAGSEMNVQSSHIYGQLMGRYIEQDPIRAASLITEMESNDQRVGFSGQVAAKLAEQDVHYALDWIKNLEGQENKFALQRIMEHWSSGVDAGNALSYILQNPDIPNVREQLATVVGNMSYNNPDALAASIGQMQETDQVVAASKLATAYSLSDSVKFNQWVNTLAPGAVRDEAVKSALSNYKNSNVTDAFSLSESISDDSLRASEMQEIAGIWFRLDPDAAEQALRSSNALSASEKEMMLKSIYANFKPSDDLLLPAKVSN